MKLLKWLTIALACSLRACYAAGDFGLMFSQLLVSAPAGGRANRRVALIISVVKPRFQRNSPLEVLLVTHTFSQADFADFPASRGKFGANAP